MKDLWVRLGCFMTGYNYMIVRNSSEATAKAVKKYLSALLIVCTLCIVLPIFSTTTSTFLGEIQKAVLSFRSGYVGVK